MTAPELVAKVQNLPPVSHTALKLVSLLDDPSASNESVVEILKFDNVLTAKLLRACNSSAFGFEEPIASVEQAVLMLGHQQILHMVLTLGFGSAMIVPLPGYAVEAKELWHHSLSTATAAEVLVKGNLPFDVETPVAFTVGLLHDIGKLVLGQVLTVDYQARIRERIEQDRMPRVIAEKEILGTDHAEVGAHLLQTWRIPDNVVEAVAHHHNPVFKPLPRLSAVAFLANIVAHVAGSAPGWEAYAVQIDQALVDALGVTPDRIDGLVLEVRESFDRVDSLMAM